MTGIKVTIDVSKAKAKLRKLGVAFNEQQFLRGVGERQLRWVNDNFRSHGRLRGGWPPLAASTLYGRRGTSAQPLRDTGAAGLAGSYGYTVGTGYVDLGSNDVKAKWHEFGTKPYTIRPLRKKSLAFPMPGGRQVLSKPAQPHRRGKQGVFTKEVHHPGSPARPMLPTKNIARQLAVDLINAQLRIATQGLDK